MQRNRSGATGFSVDYLTSHTADVDLLGTPVLVDPGQEVRGRIPRLLERFNPRRIAPAQVAEEISVMIDADQQAVREVRRAIVARRGPGHTGPHRVREDSFGVSDDIGERIATACTELLDTATIAKELTAAERHHPTAVIRDIDTGAISRETELPELMWIDERTKAAVDDKHSLADGYRVSSAVTQEVTRLLSETGVDLSHRDHAKLESSVSSIGSTLSSVAHGGSLLGMDSNREEFLARRARLGQDLRYIEIRPEAMTTWCEVEWCPVQAKSAEIASADQTTWGTSVSCNASVVYQATAIPIGRAPSRIPPEQCCRRDPGDASMECGSGTPRTRAVSEGRGPGEPVPPGPHPRFLTWPAG